MSDGLPRDETSMEELRADVDAHWAKMKAIRLQQADRNESVMDSDFWRPVVMGFVGGSFIGTAVGLSELKATRRARFLLWSATWRPHVLAPFRLPFGPQPSSCSTQGRLLKRLGMPRCRGTW